MTKDETLTRLDAIAGRMQELYDKYEWKEAEMSEYHELLCEHDELMASLKEAA